MSEPHLQTDTQVVRPADDALAEPQSPPLVAKCFGITDRGQKRATNEDQFLAAMLVKSLEVQFTSLPQPTKRQSSDHSYLLVVADGMGGAQGGEAASALAVDSVETYVLNTVKWFAHCQANDDDQLLRDFREALSEAHGRIRATAAQRIDLRGMGTTLTLAYSVNDELFLAHVGDSRGYLFRNGSLYRLTQDHTLVEEMVRRGALAPEAVAQHRWRHVITSTVGGDSPSVRIDVHKLQLEPADVILLCSDGLTEMLAAEQIAQAIMENPEPDACCRWLVDLANKAGGRDNITVVLARYELFLDAEATVMMSDTALL
jgi:protein phosphatase